MTPRPQFLAVILVLLLPGHLPAEPAADHEGPPSVLTIDDYKAELREWSQEIGGLEAHPEDSPELRAKLPPKSTVQEGARSLEISHAWLNLALVEFTAAKPERKPELLRQIKSRLSAEQEQAELFRRAVLYPTSAHEKLTEVLARREFRRVHGPSAWDLWKQRVANWILYWLERIFRKVSYTPRGGEILVWILIAAALSATAIWLKRLGGRRVADTVREPILFAPSAKHWRHWLAEAREAAQQSRWRDAIHLAYWSGISYLELSGAWVPDRSRTPREYLRLLPVEGARKSTLEALTRQFEVTWYGHREAVAEDFAETLVQLEKLGCR